MNMNDLDNLNKKLKDSMTVLDVQGAEADNVRIPDFGKSASMMPPARPAFGGHTTFKTDVQRASMNQDINEFR